MKNHAPKVHLTTSVRSKDSFEFSVRKVAGQVCRAVLAAEKCPYETEISLMLVGDEKIREINAQFRDMDKVTDVLSFPNLYFEEPSDFSSVEEDASDCIDPDTGRLALGDIIVNTARVKSQAAEFGHSELREYAFLIAHSMLHLCGYDHMTKDEAAVMEQRQDEILTSIGITRDAATKDGGVVTGTH